MSFIISFINEISPMALEFYDDSDEETIIYPEHAYEVIGSLDGDRIETYGLIWQIEGEQHAFISEELEEILLKNFTAKYTKEKQILLSELIFQKYKNEELNLPVEIFS